LAQHASHARGTLLGFSRHAAIVSKLKSSTRIWLVIIEFVSLGLRDLRGTTGITAASETTAFAVAVAGKTHAATCRKYLQIWFLQIK